MDWMKKMFVAAGLLSALTFGTGFIVGCEDSKDAGAAVEEAADDAAETAGDVAEDVENAANDAGEALQNATE